MSEHSEEPTEVEQEQTWTDALTATAQDLSNPDEETVSTDTTPPAEEGDVTSDETQVELEAEQIQETEEVALEPLEKWTDEQKEMFNGLETTAQQFLLDRHKDVESHLTKETQSLSETRKRYERLDEVLKPYDELLKPRGVELAPHLHNAMQYYLAYQQDPLSTVKNLIQSAGLDQSQVFEDDSLVDPSIRALREDNAKIRQQLATFQSQPSNDTQAAQTELTSFKTATNEDGTSKYPHFEQVRALMAPLVSQGKTMDEAYKETLWTLPEHRKAQMAAETKKATDELSKQRQKKATKAKKAADVLPSSDVDKGAEKTEFRGWNDALKNTLSNLE